MTRDMKLESIGPRYADAYAAHYVSKDLHEAMEQYMSIVAAFPSTMEADYSRSQLVNIIVSVVPPKELLDAQVKLALTRLEHERSCEVAPGVAAVVEAGAPALGVAPLQGHPAKENA